MAKSRKAKTPGRTRFEACRALLQICKTAERPSVEVATCLGPARPFP